MCFIGSVFAASLLLISRPALASTELDLDKDEFGNEKDDGKDDDDKKKPAPTKKPAEGVEPPQEEWDIYDVTEKPGKAYMFVGLDYRGNVIPAFELNLFVDGGQTIYTNYLGGSFEWRKDGFSLIPGVAYHELGTQDIIFKQKSTPDIPGNYSLVNSGMKLMYAKIDILWSTPMNKNFEFEYGLGVGLGAVFGDLENSWVREVPSGGMELNGHRFIRCNAVDVKGTGCNAADHQNSTEIKVNGYKEKTWFDGGSKPVLFPWLSVPQIGIRFKPIKNFVARLGIGWALTGFWFGIGGQYGLEQKPKP
jgi:hypothetical protein